MTANKSFNQFDDGFIPTANRAYDSIAVSGSSPLIFCVSRKGPGLDEAREGIGMG